MRPGQRIAGPDARTDAAIALVLGELSAAGLVRISQGPDGAVHYALTAAGAPVAHQMAMCSDQHATVLLSMLLTSLASRN